MAGPTHVDTSLQLSCWEIISLWFMLHASAKRRHFCCTSREEQQLLDMTYRSVSNHCVQEYAFAADLWSRKGEMRTERFTDIGFDPVEYLPRGLRQKEAEPLAVGFSKLTMQYLDVAGDELCDKTKTAMKAARDLSAALRHGDIYYKDDGLPHVLENAMWSSELVAEIARKRRQSSEAKHA